jgi:hypothetical protein
MVANELLGPHLIKQFVPPDHTVSVLDEIKEGIKRLGLQRYPLPGLAQFIALPIERIVAKDVGHGYAPFACHPLPVQDVHL